MRVSDALGQIAQIHEQLAKAEVYRGFHPVCVAASGLLGLVAAALQPWLVAADDARGFVAFWLAVAATCGTAGIGATLYAYVRTDDEYARRRTRRVAGQFVPCVVAGVAVTVLAPRVTVDALRVLPGLWTTLFSLGVFAARPYLPRATGWVALWYLTAGAALLASAPVNQVSAGWAVGLVFAVGQCATAVVLHRNEKRVSDG